MSNQVKMVADFFPRVREARELLLSKCSLAIELQFKIIDMAIDKGDFETAAKANQWLLEHMPKDKDGNLPIDISIDKVKQDTSRSNLPSINIGFNLGGVSSPKELPSTIIEVQPIPLIELEDESDSYEPDDN